MLCPSLPSQDGAGASAVWRYQPTGKQQELING